MCPGPEGQVCKGESASDLQTTASSRRQAQVCEAGNRHYGTILTLAGKNSASDLQIFDDRMHACVSEDLEHLHISVLWHATSVARLTLGLRATVGEGSAVATGLSDFDAQFLRQLRTYGSGNMDY